MRSSERANSMVLKQRLIPTLSQSFNRPQYLAGTQMATRGRILDWIVSYDAHDLLATWRRRIRKEHDYHRCGAASGMSRLGAFLLFERGESDLSTVIASIAYQLASFNSSIESVILSETDKDRNIITGTPSHQFDKLTLRPFLGTADSRLGLVVIALDGLDECGNPESRRSSMELIQKKFPKLPNTFRFLVTSRREEADLDMFLSSYPENVLAMELDYQSPTSQEDVLTYIRTEKCSADRSVVEVPSEWLWDDNMASLGIAAGGLIIGRPRR